MEIKINLPESMEIATRDGASVAVELAKVHADLWEAFATEGLAEYIRDARASALAVAYAKATGEEGDPDTRKAWGEENPDLVRAESQAMMESAVESAYAGERKARRESAGPAFTPLQDAMYETAGKLKGKAGWKDIATAFAGCKGMTTAERKQAILDCIESLPKGKREKVETAAQKTLDAFAAM